MFAGNIFISHSSIDDTFINKFIIPSVRRAAGGHYFFLNTSRYATHREGKFQHALWISAAIEACKTVILVVSVNSARSDWVKWECHTAQIQKHPIIVCEIDTTKVDPLCPCGFETVFTSRVNPVRLLEFHSQPLKARQELLEILQLPAFSVGPWRGRPLGTPWGPLSNEPAG
jgi:hypothetical protein